MLLKACLLFFAVQCADSTPGVTTHVLDTTIGKPGPGMAIDLHYQVVNGAVGDNWTKVKST